MTIKTFQDKARGCLMGGAIGDALGYPVEFIYSFDEIAAKYGTEGITNFDYGPLSDKNHGKAQISDDTQMTLYTAEGLLEAEKSGSPITQSICNAYLAWYGRQVGKKIRIAYRSTLSDITEINQRRAPGNTCLSALCSIDNGREPNNASKGCGGIMRVAPIGIYGSYKWTLEKTAEIAGKAAEITHLHPLSTYASATLALIVQLCIETDVINLGTFKEIVARALSVMKQVFHNNAPSMDYFEKIILKAICHIDSQSPDWKIIENELGGGWVAEETLAIAIFSILRHFGDFSGTIISSVNHGGDSDSTGAVAGNIIGAITGYNKIPVKFTNNIQNPELILAFADKLSKDVPNPSTQQNAEQ